MHPNTRRPRLTPAMADVRRAVRELLAEVLPVAAGSPQAADARQPAADRSTLQAPDARLVLVALSGGPDSLALAAALAFEAPRAGLAAGAIVVDHALQDASAEVAARAADQARALGLTPVLIERVTVATRARASAVRSDATMPDATMPDAATPDATEPAESAPATDQATATASAGPEAAARAARYGAFERALAATGASHVLLAHTLDDQAETVLLGLARGSGPSSLSGMSPVNGAYLRPLLGIPRRTVHLSLDDQGLGAWHDPQNVDRDYARVRVRDSVLPLLERELGPGIAEALARTADQLREDDEALDALAAEWATEIVEHAEAGIAVDARGLASNPPALAQRIVRYVVAAEFGTTLSRAQTLAALKLATEWHGQAGVDLPGIRVTRVARQLVFVRRV
ncbi:tRNA lysidine(34) synthetase TilS [Subtercola lobariae]|uniref:tRNA(Ile)-lysidine synthase n=1 Tax=Subtercola lobariae TaxID=1588641 RepID=A0A917EXK8_9MICO|nr:tRNA lysidine(34) synthetase TilS [Subtercola lobariae]GGF28882.1 tRNA(Ile)-lysidine synthase [Subtercola lobariae]